MFSGRGGRAKLLTRGEPGRFDRRDAMSEAAHRDDRTRRGPFRVVQRGQINRPPKALLNARDLCLIAPLSR